MWCVPTLDLQYVERMNELLELYEWPYDPRQPVVCLDERPVALHDSARPGEPAAPGKVRKTDYEYIRCGTANVFGIVEPKAGRHMTYATENRKKPAFAEAIKKIASVYPTAQTIHLVMDNLNTHGFGSLIKTFGEDAAFELWERFTVHYTPKHGSWLNQAEIELSLWSRQCLGHRRIPSLADLASETRAWTSTIDAKRVPFAWRFSVRDAHKRFKLPTTKAARSGD
jgi:DDE superfamily endonuclease